MTTVLGIANQKGGVGKTTTSVNLAASLAKMNRRVLLIDLDPQGNATMGSGIDKHDLEVSVYDVLVGDSETAEAIVSAEAAGYDLLGANSDLTGAEIELTDMERREYRLRDALISVRVRYDYIIIDCPPALGLLTLNGLVAADGVIIPMQCEYYALEGLTALMDTIDRVSAGLNPKLKIEGLIRTMYDPRNSLSRDVSLQLIDHFGDTVYRTVVPRNVRLAEAPSYGVPIIFYDKYSRGAKAYLALAGEVLNRHENQDGSS
ncbi:MAG: ParA family protein [Pseudomonadales bacterium]|nr:ParA family protein [Pseudomonadales bacterium]MBO6564440.1 ParA family protein [Pseudomonadales bacterium]MBO6596639.1 ParA family protein [Pseudomonadales bacterium]MBO6656504.1 ParA family protein [Pseudomonadales bacterium]MBO6703309.1 ParA family protein [Pseudomonadales bacterium]